MTKKPSKNQDSKKVSSSPKTQPSRKQNRKGGNPIRISPVTEPCSAARCSSTWICKNSACKAVLSIDDTFCKRCSCYICHSFDEDKDPSLWLECRSDRPEGESCGLSCHTECALQHGKAGVVDLGQMMQLDGSYCCSSCGKVSGILGYWKNQLIIAKDAQRVDSLCQRIYLSFRLFDGTSRYRELHEIVKDAKTKLESELGPLNGACAKMVCIIRRLSVAGEVQALCDAAIQKADEVSAKLLSANLDGQEGSACKFTLEEVTCSHVVLVLSELSAASLKEIIGYKLWYSKTTDKTQTKDPVSTFPKYQRRILISNLQPCTEYSFRIVSYTEAGDLTHSEAKCFTESVEVLSKKNPGGVTVTVPHNEGTSGVKDIVSDSGFKVRDLGKMNTSDATDLSRPVQMTIPETSKAKELPSTTPCGLELKITTVPDLNAEFTPPNESTSKDEDNAQNAEADHGSGGSENWAHRRPNGEAAAVESQSRKRSANEDSDSAFISLAANKEGGGGKLDENFEYCVKMIRELECQGYIKREFRLKLLTWFSLRSSEQERRVVNTFIQTLADDPSSLAGQLVDSFSDIINNTNKKPRNGFCSKLWH